MTPAGEMNRRISLMRQGGASGAAANDSFGQPVAEGAGGWTEIRKLWAKIDPQIAGKTSQPFNDGAYTERVQVLITLRYSKNDRVTTADRVQFVEPGSGLIHWYDVNDIANPGQLNEDLVLICTERNGGS